MKVKENNPKTPNGWIDLNSTDYISVNISYDEFLDFYEIFKLILNNREEGFETKSCVWIDKILLVDRDLNTILEFMKQSKPLYEVNV